VLSLEDRRPCGGAFWAGANGCESTRTAGSDGSVATGTAEGCPRGMLAVGSAVSGATSVIPLLLLLLVVVSVTLARGWKVGGRPGGVYCVPTST
jgi:hypothetical protein